MKLILQVAAWVTILVVSIPQEGSTGLVPSKRQNRDIDDQPFAFAENDYNNLEERALFDIFAPPKKGETDGIFSGIIGGIFGALGSLFGNFNNVLNSLVIGITDPFNIVGIDVQLDFESFFKFFFGASGTVKIDYKNTTDVIVKVILPCALAFSHFTISQNGTQKFNIPLTFKFNGDINTSVNVSVAGVLSTSTLAAQFAAKFLDPDAKLNVIVGTCNNNCTSEQVLLELVALLNVTVKNTLPSIGVSITKVEYIQFIVHVFAKGDGNLIKLIIDGINKKTPLGKAIIALIKYLNVSLNPVVKPLSLADIFAAILKGDLFGLFSKFINANGIIDFISLIKILPADLGAAIQIILKPLSIFSTGSAGFDAVAFLSSQSAGKTIATILNITNINAFKGLDFNAFIQLLINGGPGIGFNLGAILKNSGTPDVVKLIKDLQAILAGSVQITIGTLLKDSGFSLDIDGGINLPDSDLKQIVDISAFLQLLGKGCGLTVDLPSVLAKLDSSKVDVKKLFEAIKGILTGTVKIDLDAIFKISGVDDISGILKLPSGANGIDLTKIVQICLKGSGVDLTSIVNFIRCETQTTPTTTFPDTSTSTGKPLTTPTTTSVVPTIPDIDIVFLLKLLSGGKVDGLDLIDIISKIKSTLPDIGKIITDIINIFIGIDVTLKDILLDSGLIDIFPHLKFPGCSLDTNINLTTVIEIISGGKIDFPDIISKWKSTLPKGDDFWQFIIGVINGNIQVTIAGLFEGSGIPNIGEVINIPGIDCNTQLNISTIFEVVIKKSGLNLSLLKNIKCKAPNLEIFFEHIIQILVGTGNIGIGDLFIDCGLPDITIVLPLLPGCGAIKNIDFKSFLPILTKTSGLDIQVIISKLKSFTKPTLTTSSPGPDTTTTTEKPIITTPTVGNPTTTSVGPTIPDIDIVFLLKLLSGGKVDGLDLIDIISKIKSTLPDIGKLITDIIDIFIGIDVTLKDILLDSGLIDIFPHLKFPGCSLDTNINLTTVIEIISGGKIDFPDIISKWKSTLPKGDDFWGFIIDVVTGKIQVTIAGFFEGIGIPKIGEVINIPGIDCNTQLNIATIIEVVIKKSGLDLSVLKLIKCKVPNFEIFFEHVIQILVGTGNIDIGDLFLDCGLPDITIVLPLLPGCGAIKNIDFKSLLPILTKTSGLDIQIIISKLKSFTKPTLTTTSVGPDTTSTTENPIITTPTVGNPTTTSVGPTIPDIDIVFLLQLLSGGKVDGLDIIDIISKIKSTLPDIGKIITDTINILIGIDITLKDILIDSGLIDIFPHLKFPGCSLDTNINLTTVIEIISGGKIDFPDIISKWKSTLPKGDDFWGFIIDVVTGKIQVTITGFFEGIGIPNIGEVINIPGIDCNTQLNIATIIEVVIKKSGLDLSVLKLIKCKVPNFEIFFEHIIQILVGTGNIDIGDLFLDCGLPDITIVLPLLPGCGAIKNIDFKSLLPILTKTSGLDIQIIISKLKSFTKPTLTTTSVGPDTTTTTEEPIITTPTVGNPTTTSVGPTIPDIDIVFLLQLLSGGKVDGLDIIDIISKIKSTLPDIGKIITDIINIFIGIDVTLKDILIDSGLIDIFPHLKFPGCSLDTNINLTTVIEIISGGKIDFPDIISKWKSTLPKGDTFWQFIIDVVTGKIQVTIAGLFEGSGIPNIGEVINIPGIDCNTQLNIATIIEVVIKKSGLDLSVLKLIKCKVPNFEIFFEHIIQILVGTGNIDIGDLFIDCGLPDITIVLPLLPGCGAIKNIDFKSLLPILTKKSGLDIQVIISKLKSFTNPSTMTTPVNPGTTSTTANPDTTTGKDIIPKIDFKILLKLISGLKVDDVDLIDIINKVKSTLPDIDKIIKDIIDLINGVTISLKDFVINSGLIDLFPHLDFPECGSGQFNLVTVLQIISGGKIDFTDVLNKLDSTLPDKDIFWQFIIDVITGKIEVSLTTLFEGSGFPNIGSIIILPDVDCNANINISSIVQGILKKSGLNISILEKIKCTIPDFTKIFENIIIIIKGTGNVDITDLLIASGFPDISVIIPLFPGCGSIKDINLKSILPVITKTSGLDIETVIDKLQSCLPGTTTPPKITTTPPSITTTGITPTRLPHCDLECPCPVTTAPPVVTLCPELIVVPEHCKLTCPCSADGTSLGQDLDFCKSVCPCGPCVTTLRPLVTPDISSGTSPRPVIPTLDPQFCKTVCPCGAVGSDALFCKQACPFC